MKNIDFDEISIKDTDFDKENNQTRIYKTGSPSLSSMNSKGKIYFGEFFDSASKDKSLSIDDLENNEFEYEDFDKKIEELEVQIENIRELYNREVSDHETEKLKFKSLVEVLRKKLADKKNTKTQPKVFSKDTETEDFSQIRTIETKHFSQMRAMQSLLETIVNLQHNLKNML